MITFFDYLVLPFFLIWFLSIVFIFFRRDIELIWKLLFLVIFLFYFFHLEPEIEASYKRISKNYLLEIYYWIISFPKLFYFFLLFCWPVVLLRIYFSASYILSIKVIKTLISFTGLYWVLFIIYSKYSKQIDILIRKIFF